MAKSTWELTSSNILRWVHANKGDSIYWVAPASNNISCYGQGNVLFKANIQNINNHSTVSLHYSNNTTVSLNKDAELASCNSNSVYLYCALPNYYLGRIDTTTGVVTPITNLVVSWSNSSYPTSFMERYTLIGDDFDNLYYIMFMEYRSSRYRYKPYIWKVNTITNSVTPWIELSNFYESYDSEYGNWGYGGFKFIYEPTSVTFTLQFVGINQTNSNSLRTWINRYLANGALYSSNMYYDNSQMGVSYQSGTCPFPFCGAKTHVIRSTEAGGDYDTMNCPSIWPNVGLYGLSNIATATKSNFYLMSNLIYGSNKQFVLRYYDYLNGVLYSMYAANDASNYIWWESNSTPLLSTLYPKWTY